MDASKGQKDHLNRANDRQARDPERNPSRKQAKNADRRNISKDRSLDFGGLLKTSFSSTGSLDRSLNQKNNTSHNRSHDRAQSQEKVQDRSNSHGQIFDRQKKNRDESLNRNHRSKPYDHDQRQNRSLSLSREPTQTLSPASRSFGGTLRRVFKLRLRVGSILYGRTGLK